MRKWLELYKKFNNGELWLQERRSLGFEVCADEEAFEVVVVKQLGEQYNKLSRQDRKTADFVKSTTEFFGGKIL